MANEIKLNIQLSYANGNASQTFYPGSVNITQSAVGGHFPIVSLTTTYTVVSLGSISTPGIVCGRNLDATNNVLIAATTSSTAGAAAYPLITVKPGETFAFRLTSSLWRLKSSASTVKCQLQVYEN